MSRVALIKGDDRYDNVSKALKLIKEEIKSSEIRNKTVLIKPNLVTDSNPLAVTHVDSIRAVIDFIDQYNPRKLVVAEATASGSTTKAFSRYGYNRLGVELIDVNKDNHEIIVLQTIDGKEKKVKVSKTIIDADYKISVARAKTHNCVFCTLTLKNMMGSVQHVDHPWVHGTMERDYPEISIKKAIKRNYVLAKNLVTIIENIKVDLGVVDGLFGMEGDGPVNGSPIFLGTASAGTDIISVDSVMSSVMGFDPHKKGDIYLANEKGMGLINLDNIEVIGEEINKVQLKFKRHSNYNLTQKQWMKHHKNYR
jgi:uncharacterized protein (DUF362 family)